MKKLLVLILLAITVGSADAQAQRAARLASGAVTPSNVAQTFAKYWDARAFDKVLSLYAADGEFLSEQGRISGKPALEKFFKQMATMFLSSKMAVRDVSQGMSGDLAFVSGDYAEDLVLKSGPAKSKGSYVIVLRKNEGKWRIVQHIWTDETQHP